MNQAWRLADVSRLDGLPRCHVLHLWAASTSRAQGGTNGKNPELKEAGTNFDRAANLRLRAQAETIQEGADLGKSDAGMSLLFSVDASFPSRNIPY